MSELDEIAAWMEIQNEALYECHRLPTGKLDDKEIAAEVEQVRRWIEYLRRLPNTSSERGKLTE